MNNRRSLHKIAGPPSRRCDDCGQLYGKVEDQIEAFYCEQCFVKDPSFFDATCRIAYEAAGGRHDGHVIRLWTPEIPMPSVLASSEPDRKSSLKDDDQKHRSIRMATYDELLAIQRADGQIFPQSLYHLERAHTLLSRAIPTESAEMLMRKIATICKYKRKNYSEIELLNAQAVVHSNGWIQSTIDYEIAHKEADALNTVNADGVEEVAVDVRRTRNPGLANKQLKKVEKSLLCPLRTLEEAEAVEKEAIEKRTCRPQRDSQASVALPLEARLKRMVVRSAHWTCEGCEYAQLLSAQGIVDMLLPTRLCAVCGLI